MAKFKCEECKVEFEGSDSTLVCNQCGSSSIYQKEETSFFANLKESIFNYKYFFVFGLLGLSFLLFFVLGGQSEEKEGVITPQPKESKIQLKFKPMKDHIQIEMISEEGKMDLDVAFFDQCKFRAVTKTQEIKIDNRGRILPCENFPLTISWELDGFYRNSKQKFNNKKKVLKFKFRDGAAPSDDADCMESLETCIKINDDCSIELISNYDTLYPDIDVYTSINGIYGNYTEDNKWLLSKEKTTFDVWSFVLNRDTIQPVIYPTGEAMGCNPIGRASIIATANSYAKDPHNVDLFRAFIKSADKKCKFFVNGKKMKDDQTLYDQLGNSYKIKGDAVPYKVEVKMDKNKEKGRVYFVNR